MSQVVEHHRATAPKSLGIFIITCSTSKFQQAEAGGNPNDTSGDTIERLATAAGHKVVGRKMLPDSKSMLRRAAKEALALMPVDAVIVTGGTGLSPTDITIESLATVITKQIPGFGELFRRLSFDRIGSAAMMSRAIAGLVEKKVIFCLPGSPDAVQMAMQQLILPELGHVIRVARQG